YLCSHEPTFDALQALECRSICYKRWGNSADFVVHPAGGRRQSLGKSHGMNSLNQSSCMHREGFESIFYNPGTNKCGIGAHTHNILIVIIVWNTVNIRRIAQGLVFGYIAHSRILHTLNAEVEPKRALINERREALVECRIEHKIQLALCQHRQFCDSDF